MSGPQKVSELNLYTKSLLLLYHTQNTRWIGSGQFRFKFRVKYAEKSMIETYVYTTNHNRISPHKQ